MTQTIETPVLIAGAGPVGLTLALDLAWRGVDVTVVELRRAGEPPRIRSNHVSARTMETFRRLGIASAVRAVGLPDDYPNDISFRTTALGTELARISIPSRARRFTATHGPDTAWPTPEPPHRINQIFLEPLLLAHTAAQPRIRILHRCEIEDFVQRDADVDAAIRDLDTGEVFDIRCAYLVGCDGGKSAVRKKLGISMLGTPVLHRVQSTYIHAPELLSLMPGEPAWLYRMYNPRRSGNMFAIDGRGNWLLHNVLNADEPDYDSVDRDWVIRTILGVGGDFRYDILCKQDWVGRRLVAERFRDQQVFICGDAAHVWTPTAGYGMNAGIADAMNLSWLIAAVMNGWATPAILDAYEVERLPITEQVSRFAKDLAAKNIELQQQTPPEIEMLGPVGDAVRARVGKQACDLNVQQYCCSGLNFGYFYDNSPIIAHDGATHPAYTLSHYAPSSVPGCRAPHVWLGYGRSLYDALGRDYTLLRFDPAAAVSGFKDASRRRGLPLTVLDVESADAKALYARALVLVRPDQHIAWRGDTEPAACIDLIDQVRGASNSAEQGRQAFH
jgi:2-polyprenyl-6-methoxyphenol hydroxylase-like FAD-dependent oxidoreductase